MTKRLLLLLAVGLPLLVVAGSGVAQKDKERAKDGDAIFARAQGFAAAFDKGDAKAIAEFWAEDGDYTDQNGKQLKGRAAIQKAFEAFFAESKGAKLRIDSEALRFVTADVAIEDGVTEVIPADGGPPSRARYTIVHVKKGDAWCLGSVRDAAFSPPTNYEHLRGLEGLIGEWAEEKDKGQVARVSFAWAHGQNFVVSQFTTSFKNVNVGGGTSWIGWDPEAKKVRSWSFDASGGFGEGSWTQQGKTWTVKTTAVLRDGVKASATNVLTVIDADTISLSSKDRKLDGKEMPELKEVRLKRRK